MATITVDTLSDDPNAGLTLREAIAQAGAAAGADTITFTVGLRGAIHLGGAGQLTITTGGPLTIDGDRRITIDANADGDGNAATRPGQFDFTSNKRAIGIGTGVEVTLDGLTVTGGQVLARIGDAFSSAGGGISSFGTLTLLDCTVTGNSALETPGLVAKGGGIFATSLTLIDTTVSNNRSTGEGGGIAAGTAVLTRSTVSGNSTTGEEGFGGGISASFVTLTNSTVSNNSTSGERADGGGIWGTATLISSTVTGNRTTGVGADGGGIAADFASGTINLSNSIVSGNFVGGSLSQGPDAFAGTINQNGSLVGGDGRQIFATTTEIRPGIFAGVLGDNGGPTLTVNIRERGLADNTGTNSLVPTGVTTDQRGPGFARIVDGRVDIGAIEFVPTEARSLRVTTLADVVNAYDGLTSLREAVLFANSSAGTDMINFATGLAGTVHLSTAQLAIAGGSLIIDGDGRITIDANADGDNNAATAADGTELGFSARRAIDIANGLTVTLDGLTVTGGRTVAAGKTAAASGRMPGAGWSCSRRRSATTAPPGPMPTAAGSGRSAS